MPTRDGFAGDQTLFAPPFTSTDAELDEMVERFSASVRKVAKELETKLEPRPVR
jgi:adenosylmethionine-8-amino-7-oxononanoate aminotransferase